MRPFISILVLFLVQSIFSQEKSTYIYAIKGNDTLKMDVYTDNTVQQSRSRPVLLWMHGGGFSGGTRDNPAEVKLAQFAAKKGYVGISISYRLTRKDSLTGFGLMPPLRKKREPLNLRWKTIWTPPCLW